MMAMADMKVHHIGYLVKNIEKAQVLFAIWVILLNRILFMINGVMSISANWRRSTILIGFTLDEATKSKNIGDLINAVPGHLN